MSIALGFALRLWRRHTGLGLAVLLTLALGTGSVLTVAAIVQSTVLQPLGYAQEDELVVVGMTHPDQGYPNMPMSPVEVADYRARATTLADIGGMRYDYNSLTGQGEPQVLTTCLTTPGLLSTLGVVPLHGRWFTEADAQVTGAPFVVISYAAWRDWLESDPAAVGRTLQIDGSPRTVLGVMPPGFRDPWGEARLYTLVDLRRANLGARDQRQLQAFARLRPGVTIAQAQAELDQIALALGEEFPEFQRGWRPVVRPLREVVVGPAAGTLGVLGAAVALLLGVAVANAGGLLVARAARQRGEFALRQALGAQRGDLRAQALAEAIALALPGTALGLLVAWWSVDALAALGAFAFLPLGDTVRVRWPVVGLAAGLAVGISLVLSVVPLSALSRLRVSEALADGPRTTPSRRWRLARQVLVGAQLALCFPLTVGTLLQAGTLWQYSRQPVGLKTDNVVTMTLNLFPSAYPTPETRAAYYRDIQQAVARVPGLEAVALSATHPLNWGLYVEIPRPVAAATNEAAAGDRPAAPTGGRPLAVSPSSANVQAVQELVSPGYFSATGITRLGGRDFAPSDTLGGPRVVVINQALAAVLFPNLPPAQVLGRVLSVPTYGSDFEIVGVVADVRKYGPHQDAPPQIYFCLEQVAWTFVTLCAWGQSGQPVMEQVEAIKGAIWQLNPDQALANVEPMPHMLDRRLARWRVLAWLGAVISVAALALAAVGIFGQMQYAVRTRRAELGIRQALGASPLALRRLVLYDGLRVALLGLVLGALLAWPLAQWLGADIPTGAEPNPALLLATGTILLATAVAASWWPARQAAQTDPANSLRNL